MKYAISFVLILQLGLCKSGSFPIGDRIRDTKVYNINNVELTISNFGKIGQYGRSTGCWWPKGRVHNYIFGAGIWFGTLRGPYYFDTMITIWYGPHGAETEFAPAPLNTQFEIQCLAGYIDTITHRV